MARLNEPQDPLFQALNSSLKFDYRLASYDIAQSVAHAKMLAQCEIISSQELDQLVAGLEDVRKEFESDSFELKPDDEDIHMAVERRLTEIVGPVGGKLHTARSRNDQVVTDLALYVRAHSYAAVEQLNELMTVLCDLADRHSDWQLPGYTHLQRAQPVYLAHHLLAYFWMFKRDRDRFHGCISATQLMPLGAGALAGVNYQTDRNFVAKELSFSGLVENSIDAVSNRDFVLDYLSAAATAATHLSRLGAEIVLWSSEEFGFCQVSDSFASTSSIMPQKKNPDAAELLRAKAPRVVSSLTALYGVLHGLPLTYSKDLQEDKEGLFDAVDTLELCLLTATAMLKQISFIKERMVAAAADEFLVATDVADLLVESGVPFREAHGIVAELVRAAIAENKKLSELELEQLQKISDKFDQRFYDLFKPLASVEAKVSEGGTSSAQLKNQLKAARAVLKS